MKFCDDTSGTSSSSSSSPPRHTSVTRGVYKSHAKISDECAHTLEIKNIHTLTVRLVK